MRSASTLLAALSLALAACSESFVGAPCNDDSNCPKGYHCGGDKKCALGAGPAGDAGAADAGPGDGGTDGGACTDDPGCAGRENQPACDSKNKLGTCQRGGDGCLHVRNAAACPSALQTCPVGGTSCVCPKTACDPGAAQCASSTQIQQCALDTPGGCGVWLAPSACPSTNQQCTGNLPSAACVCQNDPKCTTASTKYCSGNDVASCAADTQGCLFASTAPCPSQLQTCQGAGACTCPGTSCTVGSQQCGSDGTIVTCANDVPGGCPVMPSSGGFACPAHQTCTGSPGSVSCACASYPACDSGAGTYCNGAGHLVDCQQDGNGCLYLATETDCSTQGGLVCGQGSGGGAQCVCPAASGGSFYVDSIHGADAVDPIHAVPGTGASSPPQCRFATLTAALAKAASGQTVIATGFAARPAWAAATSYAAGDEIVETGDGTRVWAAATAGTSGATEPAWPNPPARSNTVTDGTLTWQYLGDLLFIAETFPLSLDGVTLTTADCPDGGGSNCAAGHYGVAFDVRASSATSAVAMKNSARLSGFGFVDFGGYPAASMISCIGGTPSVDTVMLVGKDLSPYATNMTWGVDVEGGNATLSSVSAWGFIPASGTGAGLHVNTSGTVTLSQSSFGSAASGTPQPNDYGIDLVKGTLDATTVSVGAATKQGVIAGQGGGNPTLTATGLTVTGSTLAGVDVVGSANASLTNSTISGGSAAGLHIKTTGGVAIAGSTDIASNSGLGVNIEECNTGFSLTNSFVRQNSKGGVYAVPTTTNGFSVTLKGNSIRANGGPGVVLGDLSGAATTAVNAVVQSNTIYNNGSVSVSLGNPAITTRSVAGVALGQSVVLASSSGTPAFAGNKICNNGGDQLDLVISPFALGATSCGGNSNILFCSSTNCASGIPLFYAANPADPSTTQVAAPYQYWNSASAPPVPLSCGVNVEDNLSCSRFTASTLNNYCPGSTWTCP